MLLAYRWSSQIRRGSRYDPARDGSADHERPEDSVKTMISHIFNC
jgi:hypothetical protein